MDDYLDYERDAFIESLYSDFANDVLAGRDDLYGEIVNKFTTQRLHSYYMVHPDVATRALWALNQARALLENHPEASLVLAVAAAEVGLKSGLLKPILHGLVHDEDMAVIVGELIPEQRNRQFQRLLFSVLREFGGLDLATFRRTGAARTLWEEMQGIQHRRNQVVHRAESVSLAETGLATEIAAVVIETLFPRVIAKLGLRTDDQLLVKQK